MNNELAAAKENLGKIARRIQHEYPGAESFGISVLPGSDRYIVSELTNEGYEHPHPSSFQLGDSGSIEWEDLDEMIDQSLDFDDFVGETLKVDAAARWTAGS